MNHAVIDMNAWSLNLQLAFAITPFAFLVIGLSVCASVAFSREFEVVNRSIRSSAYLEQIKIQLGTGSYRARWMIVCGVCAALTFPGFHARIGVVSIDEIKKFPSAIKRKLVFSSWMTIVGSWWLLLVFLLIKLAKN
ncbi:hypothetical protein ACIPW4_13675 [Pseudomonas sp. NPDC089996]|uniref:hypothetical protein n=1 Tax=Pseudomonas sp. NPDC089996 TaxID=3364474 RepID=UPI003822E48C